MLEPNSDFVPLANAFRAARKRAGMTVEQVADALNPTGAFVSLAPHLTALEDGRLFPGERDMLRFAKAVRGDVAALMAVWATVGASVAASAPTASEWEPVAEGAERRVVRVRGEVRFSVWACTPATGDTVARPYGWAVLTDRTLDAAKARGDRLLADVVAWPADPGVGV